MRSGKFLYTIFLQELHAFRKKSALGFIADNAVDLCQFSNALIVTYRLVSIVTEIASRSTAKETKFFQTKLQIVDEKIVVIALSEKRIAKRLFLGFRSKARGGRGKVLAHDIPIATMKRNERPAICRLAANIIA